MACWARPSSEATIPTSAMVPMTGTVRRMRRRLAPKSPRGTTEPTTNAPTPSAMNLRRVEPDPRSSRDSSLLMVCLRNAAVSLAVTAGAVVAAPAFALALHPDEQDEDDAEDKAQTHAVDDRHHVENSPPKPMNASEMQLA